MFKESVEQRIKEITDALFQLLDRVKIERSISNSEPIYISINNEYDLERTEKCIRIIKHGTKIGGCSIKVGSRAFIGRTIQQYLSLYDI